MPYDKEAIMQQKNEQPMIYLKDLLFVVLYRWKTIITVALIFALALGGAKLFSGFSTLNSEESLKNHEKTQAILLEKYEAEKASLQLRIDSMRQQVKNQNEYLANSVYMQLDPYNFYEGNLTLYFDTGYQIMPGMEYQNLDPTDSVIFTYHSILNSEEVLLPLSQVIETEPQYLKELIFVEQQSQIDIMKITVRCPDRASAEKLMKALVEQINDIHAQVSGKHTEHQISIVNQTIQNVVDRSISDAQTNENIRMTTLVTELTDLQAQNDKLVKPVVYQIDKTSALKDGVVYAVVGGVLGVFLMAFIFWVGHIGTDKVYSARSLKNRTGVKILSCISMTGKTAIDRWLGKLEGRSTVDAQTQAQMLALDIHNRGSNIGHLLVCGSADAPERQVVLQALTAVMPGVQITDAGNALQDVAALESLSNCDTVLLLEQCNRSKYSTVTQQIEWIHDYNKQLIGCVLLGG